ncbi:MAG: 2-succinylbenzoate--CoA ligase [Cyanomargarita calcarea GSE-NOS-MK-12-04C]|jgi:O-succinylbenzoic acid--CoA ligase|uniref:2-succinylbenzoate--CoA ligase n=1 Tax=Cyanomargarita calcarea GSE-NOS-MK-12-04C TaxID=2839659 RepID=A0A951QJZ4_9CYAN|nr:2-succinylbenzoate--CoA ligase [Cyanomargarita calcarea GSE-NOS-MK-12-04C]
MERPLAHFKNRTNNDWFIGTDRFQFYQLAEELYLELTLLQQTTSPKIILAEREPVRFLASFLAACAANCSVFLCNPDWTKQEWQQVVDLVQPDIVWGVGMGGQGAGGRGEDSIDKCRGLKPNGRGVPNFPLPQSPPPPISPSPHFPHIMIPTGGSSGQIKFAVHTWETLMASVRGFTDYFQLKQVNSFCILPLYHVSGLMQFLRTFTTGGKLVISSSKELESRQKIDINPSDFFISLVPTQLQRILESPKLTNWLSQFQTVLLGGAPAWNELLEKARYYKIRLSPTYGMTETASQITTLKPDDFLNGETNSGQILPHVQVKICNQQGDIFNANQIGNITIKSESLFLGYYTPLPPHFRTALTIFQPDDLGFLDEKGYLNIVGRNSDKIITGGENVYPAEIESAIRATKMVDDICVIGISDRDWGEAVTAIYIPKNSTISNLAIQTLLKDKLSKFKIPKHWICVQSLPRNCQGKINHQHLQKIAIESLQTHL